jgi:hypothetical protein
MKLNFFTLLAVVALVQSCKKKEEEAPTPITTPTPSGNTCYVQKLQFTNNGQTFDYKTFTYDSNFKITSYMDWDDNNVVTYSGNTMTTLRYNSNNVIINTEVAQLNSSGYITSSIASGVDTSYTGGSSIAINVYDTASYQYDVNGFLTQENHTIRKVEVVSGNELVVEQHTTTFTIQNENIVGLAWVRNDNDGFSVSQNTTYTYGTTLNKSEQVVGMWGGNFSPFKTKGRKSKYLIQSMQNGGTPMNISHTVNTSGYVTLVSNLDAELASENLDVIVIYTCQ